MAKLANGTMFRNQDALNEEFYRTMQRDGIPAKIFKFENRKKESKDKTVKFRIWRKN
ncbi:MAG: hypothetical protein GY860_04740 [Desulfobacteraceae bacterium]|nr:hypothetical protein [Desulfobacteraceae bacterium]